MKLNAREVLSVLEMLDEGVFDSQVIADALHIKKMQVAGVKAWRTRGKY